MKMMKKGNDTQYVPDVFVESFKKNGFEICGENTEIAEPAKAPVNFPVNPSDNSDNNTQHNPDNSDDETPQASENASGNVENIAPVNPSDNSDNNPVHTCPYCDKEYAREGDLKNHIEKKHPAE